MSKDADHFARQLNFLMAIQDKSQGDLMRATGVSSGAASNWCKGRNPPAAAEVRKKLCELFGVSEAFLFGDGLENLQNRDKIFLEIQRLKELAGGVQNGVVEEDSIPYLVRPAVEVWREACEEHLRQYLDLAESSNPARVAWLLEEMKTRFPLSQVDPFGQMSHVRHLNRETEQP